MTEGTSRPTPSTGDTNCPPTSPHPRRGGAAPARRWCSGCWPWCCAWCSGIAIVTQVRQTESGDALETARPADLLVLLDSLQQREAALNTEVAELQRNLAAMQAAGTSDQAAIQNAQARLAALSILIGTVAATGPGRDASPSTIPAPGWRRKPCSTSSTNFAPRLRLAYFLVAAFDNLAILDCKGIKNRVSICRMC